MPQSAPAKSRAGNLLAKLDEEVSVVLYACKGETAIKVGQFPSMEEAADRVDLMSEATKSSADEIAAMPRGERKPSDLLSRGFWPDSYWAYCVDGSGHKFKYTELVWVPLEDGDAVASSLPSDLDGKLMGVPG
jgi:hypothetical protein